MGRRPSIHQLALGRPPVQALTAMQAEGDDRLMVLFDQFGYKMLSVALVEEHDLLEVID